MSRYEHLLFVCQKERPADNPKGCCKHRGAAELLAQLKMLMAMHGLKGRVRISESGCLDMCEKGVTVFAYSPGMAEPETWYTHLGPGDAESLFNQHILAGERWAEKVEKVEKVVT